jgi:hypothetical protein
VGLLNLPKNNPVAMAKLNKPINASAAESALVKKPTDLYAHNQL